MYVALGVKGSEKTLTALANTRMSISSIAATSLEAKAAILGMAYALERLTTGAATDASNLKNFAAFIDSSAEDIERWDYAAKRAGLSAESMNNSIRGVYKMIQENLTTPGKLPPGAKIFAEETKLDITKPLNYQDILRKAVAFSHSKRVAQPVINSILQSLGIGADIIGAIESGQFKLSNVDHAPILSNKEVDSLANVKSQFEGIEEKVRLFFGHFTAKHGNEIVKIIQDMTTAFLELANVLIIIADKLQIFQLVDNVFKGWGTIFKFLDDFGSGKRDEKNFLDKALIPTKKDTIDLYKSIQKDFEIGKALNKMPAFLPSLGQGIGQGIEDWVMDSKRRLNPQLFSPSPSVPQRYGLSPQNTTVNVTQHLTLSGDGTNYNDIQNMHQAASQKWIVDTMSQFDRGRQT